MPSQLPSVVESELGGIQQAPEDVLVSRQTVGFVSDEFYKRCGFRTRRFAAQCEHEQDFDDLIG